MDVAKDSPDSPASASASCYSSLNWLSVRYKASFYGVPDESVAVHTMSLSFAWIVSVDLYRNVKGKPFGLIWIGSIVFSVGSTRSYWRVDSSNVSLNCSSAIRNAPEQTESEASFHDRLWWGNNGPHIWSYLQWWHWEVFELCLVQREWIGLVSAAALLSDHYRIGWWMHSGRMDLTL